MTASERSPTRRPEIKPPQDCGSLLALSLLAPIVGAASGLVGAVFRLALSAADRFRGSAIAWAHGDKFAGLLVIVGGCAGAVALAAWLVRWLSPDALGSGIPQVEAILKDDLPSAPSHLLFVRLRISGLTWPFHEARHRTTSAETTWAAGVDKSDHDYDTISPGPRRRRPSCERTSAGQ